MDIKKSFGLIIPKKNKAFDPKNSGIFGSDSDEDSTPKRKMPKIPQSKPIPSKTAKMELVDPSIYEYDSIYDDMKAQKAAEITPKEKKSARYIDCLLKAADKRKKEHERRLEKKVQLEREKEGDKFKDKEMFVTSAYKKKMQEREEEEEREQRENQLNDMMDVTKQNDLSGFYRHFLKQSVGEVKVPVFGEKMKIKEEPQSSSDNEQILRTEETTPVVDDKQLIPDDKDYSDSDKSSDEEENSVPNSYEKSQRIRKYRKRASSDHSDEDNNNHSKNSTKIPSKSIKEQSTERSHDIDMHTTQKKNSSFETPSEKTIDQPKSHKRSKEETEKVFSQDARKRLKSCSDENSSSSEKNGQEQELSVKVLRKRNDSNSSDVSNSSSDDQKQDEESPEKKIMENGVKSNESDKDNNSKPSRNIYEKRTIGEVFANAQMRYFQRLATLCS